MLCNHTVLGQMNVFAFVYDCVFVLQWTCLHTLAMWCCCKQQTHNNNNHKIQIVGQIFVRIRKTIHYENMLHSNDVRFLINMTYSECFQDFFWWASLFLRISIYYYYINTHSVRLLVIWLCKQITVCQLNKSIFLLYNWQCYYIGYETTMIICGVNKRIILIIDSSKCS